jgi:hypothetical protein
MEKNKVIDVEVYNEYLKYLNGYIKEFMIPTQNIIPNENLITTDLDIKEEHFKLLFNIPDLSKTQLTNYFVELSKFLDGLVGDFNVTQQVSSFCLNKALKAELGVETNVLVVGGDESYKKITKTTKIKDYEVMTDSGWVDIEALHETIEYQVYELKMFSGRTLKCADNHIVIDGDKNERFVKDLTDTDWLIVEDEENGVLFDRVESVTDLGYKEVMYDLELTEDSNRRYFTNGILSHNTHLTKVLAENMFGDADSLIRMDMSEYMEKHSVSRLIGPPPGYVGYEEGGQLTEKVRRKPYSVILFDEIEKANDDVFNILLQLLDEGQLTDGLGRKINFKNCLIILTSNIGVKELNSFGKSMGFKTDAAIANEEERARSIIEKALKKKFKPEFLNRIDDTIIFNSLSKEDIHKIIYIELDKLKGRILELGYKLSIQKSAIEYVAKQGYDEAYGARPLNRAIQRHIEDPVADGILSGNFPEGTTIKISYDKKEDKIVLG